MIKTLPQLLITASREAEKMEQSGLDQIVS